MFTFSFPTQTKIFVIFGFQEHLIHTIYEEYDHIVRSEAAKLITIIYDQQNLSPEILVKFYDSMSYAATEDTSSNVRKNALQFWKIVIQKYLALQGMIDGEFPDVTFSKESKKIVILNDCEIGKRIVKVLHQLSEAGCLSVLKTALQDFKAEVCELAKNIVTDLYDLLKRYQVENYNIDSYSSKFSSFQLNNFLEIDLSCKLKGRHILPPKLFLDHVRDYFENKKHHNRTEAFKKPILESILEEIVSEEPIKHPNDCIMTF